MRSTPFIAICLLVLLCAPAQALSSITARDYAKLAHAVQKDFGVIDVIRTVVMAPDEWGRFDVIVIGGRPNLNAGWRAEVFSFEGHRFEKTWDSAVSASEVEFENSGPTNMSIHVSGYDYDFLITGCVPHNCGGGIRGYLTFNGATRKAYKAKLTTQGTEYPDEGYIVEFSRGITAGAKQNLKRQICADAALNKKVLPFSCATSTPE